MTTYQVAKAAEKLGVSETSVYRLARVRGRPARIDAKLLSALCDVFGVGPGELLERDKPRRK